MIYGFAIRLCLVSIVLSGNFSDKGESGYASYYTVQSSGSLTSSGEKFHSDGYTCAMRRRDFGKWYLVTYRDKAVIVKHNDYGPKHRTRLVDLSRGAMRRLGGINKGIIPVKIYCIWPIRRITDEDD